MASAFFYGTLMSPPILTRVIQNNGQHLTVAPAILLNHTRHHVKGCDYPAVIPYEVSRTLCAPNELSEEERSVRGTVVHGLTSEDVLLLHEFEGDEYSPSQASVYPLSESSPMSISSTVHLLSHSSPIPNPLPLPVVALVYIWCAPVKRLAPTLWSYDTFVREKLHRWVASDPSDDPTSEDTPLEVDRRRQMGGVIITPEEASVDGDESGTVNLTPVTVPPFGHAMARYFNYPSSYLNLNHGSYGSLPIPVMRQVQEWGLEVEQRPDKFIRRTYSPILQSVREQVAKLINAETDECVIVPNTPHGISTILANIEWEADDVLISFSTTFNSVSKNLQYISDIRPHPTHSVIPLDFTTSPQLTHSSILELFRSHIHSLPPPSGSQKRKILAVIDGIISVPSSWMPWEEIVQICKEEGVISLVDAAHCLGQIPIDLKASQPDFWIANAHKWLYSKRSGAVLYVPKRNQALIKSTFPTSLAYVSPSNPVFPSNFVAQFDYTGSSDIIPFLSIAPALDFRKAIGGESKIYEYCHDLAIRGGQRMAEIWGTRLLDTTPNFEWTACMVDVLLPLRVDPSETREELSAKLLRFQDKMLENECFTAPFVHGTPRQWWVRASAQIWLDVSDFEKVAVILSKICKELES